MPLPSQHPAHPLSHPVPQRPHLFELFNSNEHDARTKCIPSEIPMKRDICQHLNDLDEGSAYLMSFDVLLVSICRPELSLSLQSASTHPTVSLRPLPVSQITRCSSLTSIEPGEWVCFKQQHASRLQT